MNRGRYQKMSRYWLSFELGLRGNYEALYEWLDGLTARECGDSVATFECNKSPDQIKKELSPLLGPAARVYLVGRTNKGGYVGRFVLGKRKRAPWEGYGAAAAGLDDEEEG